MSTEKKRARLTIEIDEELQKSIELAADGRGLTMRDLCLEAIDEFLNPSFEFFTPSRRNPAPLADFLHQAHEGLIMVGVTLSSLQDEAVEKLLANKIVDEGISMRFVIIDPKIPSEHPVFTLLSKRYEFIYGEAGLRNELEKTCAVLERLQTLSRESGTTLRVLGIQTLPMSGLTIIEPHSVHTRIRVALYLHMQPYTLHRFFEVDMRRQRGRFAGEALLEHYELLTDGARLIIG